MEVAGQVALRFTDDAGTGLPVNLTAVQAQGAHLWVAGDEAPAIGRLVLDSTVAPTRAGRQRGFRLADLVQLPGAANGEADLKGIASTERWLWVISSHALVRRRPKPEHDDLKVVRRLGRLRRDPNRYVIARLATQLGVDRHPEPVRVSRDGRRSALIGAPGAENLVDLLRSDAHLAPFLSIPGQDNGFEVQGLAAVGDRLYVGLRGPVLRGWAVVIEVGPAADPTDPGRLALGILPEGARYRKHFLDLGGLGVRGLCPDGDDILVLAGPAMSVSGPVRVHRWLGANAGSTGPVVREADIPVEAVVPHGEGDDHPAGMTLLARDPHDPRPQLLVIYDAPNEARRPWPDTVLADRVRIGREPVAAAAETAGSVGPVQHGRAAGGGTVGPATPGAGVTTPPVTPAYAAVAGTGTTGTGPTGTGATGTGAADRTDGTGVGAGAEGPAAAGAAAGPTTAPDRTATARTATARTATDPARGDDPAAPDDATGAAGPEAGVAAADGAPDVHRPATDERPAGPVAVEQVTERTQPTADPDGPDDAVPAAGTAAPATEDTAAEDTAAPTADDTTTGDTTTGDTTTGDTATGDPATGAATDEPAAEDTGPGDPTADDPTDDPTADDQRAALRRFRADGRVAEHLLHSSAAMRYYGPHP